MSRSNSRLPASNASNASHPSRPPRIRHPPPSTISGYVRKEVYRALDEAILDRDGEKACCLAVELALTPNEAGALVSHLVDTYGSWYASVDATALERFARAVGHIEYSDGICDWTPSARRGLCEAVLILSNGLPRHDASAVFLEASGTTPEDAEDEISASGVLLLDAIRTGHAVDALRIARHMVTSPVNGMPFAAWDAILATSGLLGGVSKPPGASKIADFASHAHRLFHVRPQASSSNAVPCMSSRQRRAPLAMAATLVAVAQATSSAPSSWLGSKADEAIVRGIQQIDSLFQDLLVHSPRRFAESDEDDVNECDEDDAADEFNKSYELDEFNRSYEFDEFTKINQFNERRLKEEEEEEEDRTRTKEGEEDYEILPSYLRLYTTTDYANQVRACQQEMKENAKRAKSPVRTIKVTTAMSGMSAGMSGMSAGMSVSAVRRGG